MELPVALATVKFSPAPPSTVPPTSWITPRSIRISRPLTQIEIKLLELLMLPRTVPVGQSNGGVGGRVGDSGPVGTRRR